jgi:hypothetical protein
MEKADRNIRVPKSLLDRVNTLCSKDAVKKGNARPTIQWIYLDELITKEENRK